MGQLYGKNSSLSEDEPRTDEPVGVFYEPNSCCDAADFGENGGENCWRENLEKTSDPNLSDEEYWKWKGNNHAALVVGYGTEIIKNKPVDYWLVKNSYGTRWGDNGYLKIKRGTGHCGFGHQLNTVPI